MENRKVDAIPEPRGDALPDAEEIKPRLILFLSRAKEILRRARRFARKSEQQMRTLLREDPPSLPQEPHSPQPAQEIDPAQQIADGREPA